MACDAVAMTRDDIPLGGTTGVAAQNGGTATYEAEAELSLPGPGHCVFIMVMCVHSCEFLNDFNVKLLCTLQLGEASKNTV